MNVGNKIRAIRQLKKMSILELANAIGSDVGNVSRQERGKQGITEETLAKIAHALNVKVSDLFLEEEPFDIFLSELTDSDVRPTKLIVKEWESVEHDRDEFVEIPLLNIELSAGNGSYEITEDSAFTLPFRKYSLNKMGVSASNARIVKVIGDSMFPRLSDGDVVGVDVSDTKIRDGKTYAIRQGKLLRVKVLIEQPDGGIIVRSINREEFPDEYITQNERDDTFCVIGRVFWSASTW